MTDEERRAVQAEIDAVPWFHEFDFGNGLQARSKEPDTESHRDLWEFMKKQLDEIDFAGKTVLDVGCWDGYWSFYAEQRGARSVLATDDKTQNWSNGGGVMLARRLLNSSIEVNQNLPVYELASLNRTFDIILCLSVYYHLVDPFYAFAQLRQCCHPGTMLDARGRCLTRHPRLTLDLFRFQEARHNDLHPDRPTHCDRCCGQPISTSTGKRGSAPPRPPSLARRLEILHDRARQSGRRKAAATTKSSDAW